MTEHILLEVQESSQVGSTRRHASELARAAGLSETEIGRVALVTTEVASNVVKHGGGGHILVRRLREAAVAGLEIVAIDRGAGMRSVAASLRDGCSTAGTKGTGLGAISRLADVFDAYSTPGAGTAILAQVCAPMARSTAESTLPRFGAVCVAKPGQEVSGDAWAVAHLAGRTSVLVVDGLGHGPAAADAAAIAIRVFAQAAAAPPAEVVERLHAALRATRGAALAVADADWRHEVVRYAGVGNIAGTILHDGASRSLVSYHGTAGHDARRIQEFAYPFPSGATLAMNSDGLLSSWTTERYPGLLQHHPTIVAAVLYRDFTRGRDDATVVVLRGNT